ncbi:MAG: hypothetical protein LBQ63_08135 [Deltaproteobacteria bacterium]|jgi:hypothetical protein|nr:hypothetical protein [Deltaproteobacteria bacterium]
MHPSIALLEQVSRLAEKELHILESEGLEGLEENSARRGDLIRRAWLEKSGCSEQEFVSRLMIIQSLQRALQKRAETLLEEAGAALNENKKKRQGIFEYCRIGLGRLGKAPRVFKKCS